MKSAIENMQAALAELTAKAERAEQATKAGQDNISMIRAIVARRNAEKSRRAESDRLMPTMEELAELA